jgi:predicted ribosome quality control (RQC) complex YloA/Tae2 family protein
MGLFAAFNKVKNSIEKGGVPVMLSDACAKPFDYSFLEIEQYGKDFEIKSAEGFSILLDKFYAEKENAARVAAAAHDITKLVKNLYSRTQKKLGLRLIELEKCRDREKLRIYGELIKANLYRLNPGDTVARVENYYDENLNVVEIPLNPALSPSKNADRYFKEYKKTYSAQQTLTELTEKDREELIYFESVLDNISRSETLSEIREIREELTVAGYLRRIVQRQKNRVETAKPLEFVSREGYKIMVGKNNIQNDYLTTKLAGKNDLWFHVKGIPGSHVIVFCEGKDVSDETVLYAAKKAAENSKAKASSGVAVDYTPIKYVKKPAGAKPGMVIYTTNKTVYVTPEKEAVQ